MTPARLAACTTLSLEAKVLHSSHAALTQGDEKPNGKTGGQGDDHTVLAIRMQVWTLDLLYFQHGFFFF